MIVKRLNLFLECTLAVFILIGFLIQPVTAEEQKFQEEIVPFLKQYCMECHDESTSKGRLSLERIDPRIAGGPDFEKWRIVLERVKFHDMPPAKADQPLAAERKA